MFAHGQVEGLREKYGMEFRRAYWNETPNAGLVARHEREIFPLLQAAPHLLGRRTASSCTTSSPRTGSVNEDVFAYSNRRGDERGLVLYNNRFAEARGWVRTSAAFAVKTADGKIARAEVPRGGPRRCPNDPACYAVFRDHASGLQYIRSCRELWEKGTVRGAGRLPLPGLPRFLRGAR